MANQSINNRLASRLITLRKRAGISARDMSLSIDQNPGYINNIEHGKALPSMEMFLKICDRLEVSPAEFFEGFEDDDSVYTKLHQIIGCLSEAQASALYELIHQLL